MLINNESFSKNKKQNPEWYDGFEGISVNGFPNRYDVITFLQDLAHLYIIENPLNWDLVSIARAKRIKVYIASNYEFCDNLNRKELPIPDLFLMPSRWKVADMKNKFGNNRVRYLPPPIFPEEFKEVREINLNRSGRKRFLHVVGTLAAADRNGTLLLLEAIKHCKQDFELVVKSQHPLPDEYLPLLEDPRISFKIGTDPEVADIYRDFDAMIMPRRFGGLCLPMQEALMSALPVIMPDISPNQEVLPREWLVDAWHDGYIQTRAQIDLYRTKPEDLALKIDEFALLPQVTVDRDKLEALDIAIKEFAPSSLTEEYNKLWL